MFIREKKVKGHVYYQWVESYRENGKMKQRVVKHIGNQKERDKVEYDLRRSRRWLDAIERFPILVGMKKKEAVEWAAICLHDNLIPEMVRAKCQTEEEFVQAVKNGQFEIVKPDLPVGNGYYYGIITLKPAEIPNFEVTP